MTHSGNKMTPLHSLESHDEFIGRHIGPREEDIIDMLKTVGCSSLEELMRQTMPESILSKQALKLPKSENEERVLQIIRDMASKNTVTHAMIGLGYHPTITPPVILRNVLENPGWYTAYTPYQAEISQGRLEGMLNFQQMVMDLTGMELANASLLDEATAAAEAMAMLKRINRRNKSDVFLVDANCLPQTVDVVKNRARHLGLEVKVSDDLETALDEQEYFGILVQYPGADGQVKPLAGLVEKAHEKNALVAVAADLMALVMLESPGQANADVVVGNSQRFGVPMAWGGPHAAFFATRESYRRNVPGRIIGVSKDRHGKVALRMALQTREQHIRREKAMSNICTAQALLAVMSGFYAVWHGPEGLERIAGRIHRQAAILADGISAAGFELEHNHYFDTLSVKVDEPRRQAILDGARKAGINLRADREGFIGISTNEQTRRHHITTLLEIFADGRNDSVETIDARLEESFSAIPSEAQRRTPFMEHEIFSSHRSETDMLRYLKRLENRDLSLVHSMIPLGSCTMKLNATAEMIPITWPEFSELHPFCPPQHARGYHELVDELEAMLCEVTGFDAFSLQPNAGSQGEYAGLLAIKGWHESRNDHHRDVCLIPSSAHGTNPASASMLGMKIVVVKCDQDGNIDLDDLNEKIDQHREQLAALMITYPSTHGVFEEAVVEICEQVQNAGGLVYMDGANLNALVGWSQVGDYADVCHLNLHKTFCIPHGGGGPGAGPIGVREKLIPFLPGHGSGLIEGSFGSNRAIAAAPWGSAGILPIPWAYIRMMGSDGLKRASEVAVLSANYIAKRLEGHYDVLYTGRSGRVAHECIVDLRPFKDSAGIVEEDVAKRLMDFGFHAPTMSWPVPGTLMIEPTESESREELDRFIDAMIVIRKEIARIADGELDREDNPLRQAPHTIEELTADEWNHSYTRQEAGWPLPWLRAGKYFAYVGRVDNVYGDRNLVCSCPPMEDWMEEAG